MPPDISNMLTACQQHFADTPVRPSEKSCLRQSVTDKEFRGWVREWFKDQVRDRAEDVDRRFARMVHMSATEVNHIVNDKRYPTWKQIAKVTENLDVRADEFLLSIVKRAREDIDSRAGGASPPHGPSGGPPGQPPTHADDRARILAEAAKRRRDTEGGSGSQPAKSRQADTPRPKRKRSG